MPSAASSWMPTAPRVSSSPTKSVSARLWWRGGIIARAIDHLWEDVDRIDIVYICSNAAIARANLPKLRVSGASKRSFALATRLTMLATELAPKADGSSFMDNKLNFVSFTPGTSFDMGHSVGQRRETGTAFSSP